MPSLDTAGSLFFFALVAGPILAAVALVAAHRHGRAHAADYGALVIPAVLFLLVGYAREELRTGWALILRPILIGVLSTYLLAGKVLIVDRNLTRTNRTSLLLLAALTIGALVFALLVPPLLE
jgi:hypothetical protein